MRVSNRSLLLFSLAGLLVIALLYYLVVISPALSRERVLKGYVAKHQEHLAIMLEMKARWESFQKARVEAEKSLQQRGADFTLLSYLEQMSRESGMERKIRYMKPLSYQQREETYRQEGIEMQLEDIDVRQLVEFLYKIEHSGKLLSVDRLKIRPVSRGDVRLLEVTLQVKTYRLSA